MPSAIARPAPWPLPAWTTLTRYCFTYFYMKTWICPNTTVFDPTNNVCTTCNLPDCVSCFNLTSCSVCVAGFVINSLTGLC